MSSRIVAFLALLALYSPQANGAEFLTSSILALVVGDNQFCPSSPVNSTCDSFTAPIQLVEYNGLTAAALSVQYDHANLVHFCKRLVPWTNAALC